MKKLLLCFFIGLVALSLPLHAQNKTISSKNTDSREAAKAHKVMLIPFEPKLYMSQIDMSVNRETKLTAKEIKYKFRDGINEQLFKALKSENYNVLDLMEDTAKYKKERKASTSTLATNFRKCLTRQITKRLQKKRSRKK